MDCVRHTSIVPSLSNSIDPTYDVDLDSFVIGDIEKVDEAVMAPYFFLSKLPSSHVRVLLSSLRLFLLLFELVVVHDMLLCLVEESFEFNRSTKGSLPNDDDAVLLFESELLLCMICNASCKHFNARCCFCIDVVVDTWCSGNALIVVNVS